ncbi:hypothetical protein NAL32_18715 [Chryseobacterium sp. Ch-15]|uniref:Uncharacterized protein n=1 Tax=Chryseobacterium muglaense TaxID=2893752 RepID=A0A9Q3UZT7_9FLAO|nr:hypothetical protein [Chryseobacterium muglaense]MBD3907241.1 hypothetical protein [Chryseobacterium muglaense]MCC9036329.1 hypothetical protein [Chryseobacterium muglaense]MCM2556424.1 hypothetical protein [Chryseobacterium muglaense]
MKFNHQEIRIYKDYQTSTGVELFRMYQDNNENWKAEFYNTVATKNNNKDEITIRIRKSKLNSLKNLEMIWLQILDTQVIHLPQWETFQYKLKTIKKEYQIEDGELLSSYSKIAILDGASFYVKIKNDKIENEFMYSNPESYLETYPNVDELLSIKELLTLIRNEFNIFIKH